MSTLCSLGMVCALGADLATIRRNLFAGTSPGLRASDACSPGTPRHLGFVDAPLPTLADHPTRWRSRNNALLLAALAQIRDEVEAACRGVDPTRIAVVLGTSTTGIAEGEVAMGEWLAHGRFPAQFHYAQQELGSPAEFLAARIGSRGPAYVISTACTSSAKALAAGARLLATGVADVVLAGGADTLCRFTVAGFAALEALSTGRCNPFSSRRDGINIGEGAALFLMQRGPGPVRLAGWGESSDGHHVSAPDPCGAGARRAVAQALARAGRGAADIGYVNLHGTGTPLNDAMEATLAAELLPGVPASSTKPLTGHTLGAAGAIEAGIAWLTLTGDGTLPPHCWDGNADPALPALTLIAPAMRLPSPPRAALSHSFAFGGNNVALLLEHA
ncbi:beta-ketoacyl-ACP synthase [Chitiniphilus purpureus]|uniref:Beta-ketoacyl-ACP synthase n=1 Tax=Chitiniphilus purpureus TaxID=2981137 RepID=A0ABY6DQK0_9NEIS|nr:beta-ketoacyl-ACP synthase [Chitiniphilus sp. CD1]UXY15998.1 beta-ketoacyl-ACP synthase [Chitiniphilus sp. CD1]